MSFDNAKKFLQEALELVANMQHIEDTDLDFLIITNIIVDSTNIVVDYLNEIEIISFSEEMENAPLGFRLLVHLIDFVEEVDQSISDFSNEICALQTDVSASSSNFFAYSHAIASFDERLQRLAVDRAKKYNQMVDALRMEISQESQSSVETEIVDGNTIKVTSQANVHRHSDREIQASFHTDDFRRIEDYDKCTRAYEKGVKRILCHVYMFLAILDKVCESVGKIVPFASRSSGS
ncbi:MAG: hypothetical protein KDA64_06370 [Rhodospirillaceae bacterium]|nr:hypothetical protein [Rhodospirillaceae bacterium]